jgi:hypothetical protein
MRPVTSQFLGSLRYSHVIAAGCDLIFPGHADADAIAVPVEAGQITIDRTAQNRRAGSIQIPWSLNAGEDLGVDLRELPLGGYALVRRGLRYADGSTELVSRTPRRGNAPPTPRSRSSKRSSGPASATRNRMSRPT